MVLISHNVDRVPSTRSGGGLAVVGTRMAAALAEAYAAGRAGASTQWRPAGQPWLRPLLTAVHMDSVPI